MGSPYNTPLTRLVMSTFEDLVTSRKGWIENVLKPWCLSAPRLELLKAEQEWHDIAGRVDAEGTLWLWAWSRFPALVVEGLHGIDESYEVTVMLKDGGTHIGFPDSNQSHRGQLVLQGASEQGPFPLDDIRSIERTS